jgi:hypothetical protein
MMEEYGDDGNDFSEYEKSRKLTLMLLQNFHTVIFMMSSKTADDKFYCRRRLKNGFR